MTKQRLSVAPLAGAVAIAGAAVFLVACSSSPSSSKKTASPAVHQTSMPSSKAPKKPMPSDSPTLSAAACAHAKSLRGSLTSVTHVTYNSKSATVITADLKNIKTQVAALKSEPALSGDMKALSADVTKVQDAAKGITTPPSPAQLKAVLTALAGLKATATPTIAKLKAACP